MTFVLGVILFLMSCFSVYTGIQQGNIAAILGGGLGAAVSIGLILFGDGKNKA